MAEPIIIVKEGSLTVEVLDRKGKRALWATFPGIKVTSGRESKLTRQGRTTKITWKKKPSPRKPRTMRRRGKP